jgi:hypothetical protein
MSSKSSRILHQSKDYYSTVASQQDEILVKNVWVKFRVFPLTNNLKTTEKSCVISYWKQLEGKRTSNHVD